MSLSRPSKPKAESEVRTITDAPRAEDLSPVLVEDRIQKLLLALDAELETWSTAYGILKKAEETYDVAFARAKIKVPDTVPYADRGQHATLETIEERQAKDVAKVAYEYAEKKLEVMMKALSGWQSINKSVDTAYRNAGRL